MDTVDDQIKRIYAEIDRLKAKLSALIEEELKKEYVTIRKSLEGFPYNAFMKCDLYKK